MSEVTLNNGFAGRTDSAQGRAQTPRDAAGQLPARSTRTDGVPAAETTTAKPAETRDAGKPESARVDAERLGEALREFQKSISRDLEIRVDDASGRMIVTVLDGETQDVIRQIPAEEVLRASEAREQSRALLFDAEV